MKRLLISATGLLALLLVPLQMFGQTEQEIRMAEEFFSRQEFDKAIRFYQRFQQYEPGSYDYFNRYVYCLVQTGQEKEALSFVRKQGKKFEHLPDFQFELYQLTLKVEGPSKADRYFDQILKNLPRDFESVDELAMAFMRAAQPERSMRLYARAEQIMGFNPVIGYRRIEIAHASGQTDEEVQQIMTMLRDYPREYPSVQSLISTLMDEHPQAPFNMALKQALQRETQKSPDATQYGDLLMWVLVQEKNFKQAFLHARALDKRLREDGGRVMQLARVCLENRDFATATQCFQYVVDLGKETPYYLDARVGLVETLDRSIQPEGYFGHVLLPKLDSNYQALIRDLGAYPQVNQLKINYARLLGFGMRRVKEGLRLLDELERTGRCNANDLARLRLEKADLLILDGDYWEPSLLYGQVEKQFPHDLPGQEAKFRNARLAYFRQEFGWSLTQAKVLKAATSRLIANDAMALSLLIGDNMGPDSANAALAMYARADLHAFCGRIDEAMQTLDSLFVKYPVHDVVDEAYMLYAQLLIKNREFERAAAYYEEVLKDFPTGIQADDALMALAGLYEGALAQPEKAAELYQRLLAEYPGSVFAAEARKRYRELMNRG